MEEEDNNQAWNMLLESLQQKDEQIINFKKREIELLQKLMKTEENVKGLIQVISKKLYGKKPENIEEEKEEHQKGGN